MNFAFELQKDKPLREDNRPRRGYRMITTFDIENFRCFEHLHLENLRRINIIVGDNGSGKTALIEALFLAAYAHPRAVTFMRELRKRPLPEENINWTAEIFRSLWEDLFFNFHDSQPIKAKFVDSAIGNFAVDVSYVWPESASAFSGYGPIPYLVFRRYTPDLKPDEPDSKATVTLLKINEQGNPVMEGPKIQLPHIYLLPSTTQFFPEELARYFSDLSRENLENSIIRAMKEDFPQISNISVLTDGVTPGLFATTESVPNRKVPLATVSAGAARYLNMLIPVTVLQKGVVLVDEIENGLYWKKMPNIWKRLRQICEDREVQLFVTTHSDECLQSLIEAMQGHEGDFSLIRTVNDGEGTRIKQIDGEIFLAALEQHGEIR